MSRRDDDDDDDEMDALDELIDALDLADVDDGIPRPVRLYALLLRADVLARTGLTDQQYEAARDRLARLRDTLPNRLAGIGAKHFSRSGRRTHAGRGARPHE